MTCELEVLVAEKIVEMCPAVEMVRTACSGTEATMAAAYATLLELTSHPILETIAQRGQRLMDGIMDIFSIAGIPACINGYPAMFSYAMGVESVSDQRSWDKSDKEFYLILVDALIERGVMPDHDPREPWFLCYAHGDAEIDKTLEIFRDAVKMVKR